MTSCTQALTLTPLVLTSLGGVLNSDGVYLYEYYVSGSLKDYEDFVAVEFGGALGALAFCVSFVGLFRVVSL